MALSVRSRTDGAGACGHSRRMIHPVNTSPTHQRPHSVERREYLIDGHRVSFMHQADWHCACREFSARGQCRHTREARGMRDAQALIERRTHQIPGERR